MYKQLTKAEEQIMLVLWELEFGTVKDIRAKLPEPQPAYNTVSTIVRILENKKFIKHKTFGKGYLYYPAVKKEVYSNERLSSFIDGYFSGSFQSMVSFFVKKNNISVDELDSILDELNKNSKT